MREAIWGGGGGDPFLEEPSLSFADTDVTHPPTSCPRGDGWDSLSRCCCRSFWSRSPIQDHCLAWKLGSWNLNPAFRPPVFSHLPKYLLRACCRALPGICNGPATMLHAEV